MPQKRDNLVLRKPGGGPCESDDELRLEDEGFNQEKGKIPFHG